MAEVEIEEPGGSHYEAFNKLIESMGLAGLFVATYGVGYISGMARHWWDFGPKVTVDTQGVAQAPAWVGAAVLLGGAVAIIGLAWMVYRDD